MDDEMENYPESIRPPKRGHPQQIQTDNMFTYTVENTDRTEKRRNLLISRMLWSISGRTKGISQGNKEDKSPTIYRPVDPQINQNETENVAMAWIDYEKAYDMVL